MPVHRDFDRDDRILRTTIVGAITLEDVDEHLKVLRRRRAETRPELIDARLACAGRIPVKALRVVAVRARFAIGNRQPARRAVVVSSEEGAVIARRFATFVAGWVRVGVFDDMDAAYDWVRQPAWTEALARISRACSL